MLSEIAPPMVISMDINMDINMLTNMGMLKIMDMVMAMRKMKNNGLVFNQMY